MAHWGDIPNLPSDDPAVAAWPRTNNPLRVAILGWADIALQQWEGSGYNLAASELARGLSLAGHDVSYLASGMRYSLRPGPRIKQRAPWWGINRFDLINSPNLSPSFWNFRNVTEETASPRTSQLVNAWLDDIRAQVVHVHSMEGFGLDLIQSIAQSGRPVVVTPHNYWFLCPQVDLFHEEKRVCEDYQGGKRCETCMIPPATTRQLKFRRARFAAVQRIAGRVGAELLYAVAHKAAPAAKRRLGLLKPTDNDQPVQGHERYRLDPELHIGFNIQHKAAENTEKTSENLVRWSLPLLKRELGKDFDETPFDQNERVLKNADRHLVVLNNHPYGLRRSAGVTALNHAAAVIPPSDFLRKVHVSMGVKEERTRWVRLGLPHLDRLNRRVRRSPSYRLRPWSAQTSQGPLRFAFLGTTRPNKGLEVLVRAIPLLETHIRERAHFLIRAHGDDWAVRKRLASFPQVHVSAGFDDVQLLALVDEYDVGILPHLWMENSPLVLLEHYHAGKFVISTRLGGPVDWVNPPHNGLLFQSGKPEDLAKRITELVRGDVQIPSPAEIHERTTLHSYPDHVAEVESIYHTALANLATSINNAANTLKIPASTSSDNSNKAPDITTAPQATRDLHSVGAVQRQP